MAARSRSARNWPKGCSTRRSLHPVAKENIARLARAARGAPPKYVLSESRAADAPRGVASMLWSPMQSPGSRFSPSERVAPDPLSGRHTATRGLGERSSRALPCVEIDAASMGQGGRDIATHRRRDAPARKPAQMPASVRLTPEGRPSGVRRLLAHRLQAAALASRIIRHSTSGVAGMSTCRTPTADSASTRAFITLVTEPAQPDSPTPLAPSGLPGVIVGRW